MNSKRAGRWAALFGGRRTRFKEELASARPIRAEWRIGSGQRDIVIEEDLPGWLDPLWGVDDGWLYLRRPEGVWKSRMPIGFATHDTPVLIYQKRDGRPRTNNLIGALRIGGALSGSLGWCEGVADANAISAAELDDRAAWGLSDAGLADVADCASDSLGRTLVDQPERLLVAAGDDFGEPPAFKVHGHWLLAESRQSAWTMAYLMESGEDILMAVREGRLWLRWSGRWLDPLEVKVDVVLR